jgi:hypothetical protein
MEALVRWEHPEQGLISCVRPVRHLGTCTGCCDGTTCRTGNTNQACGSNGPSFALPARPAPDARTAPACAAPTAAARAVWLQTASARRATQTSSAAPVAVPASPARPPMSAAAGSASGHGCHLQRQRQLLQQPMQKWGVRRVTANSVAEGAPNQASSPQYRRHPTKGIAPGPTLSPKAFRFGDMSGGDSVRLPVVHVANSVRGPLQ